MVKLPEGLVVGFKICQRSSESCLDTATPDSAGLIRVGLHAYDRSYVGYNLTFQGLVVGMECSVSGPEKSDLQFLMTPMNCNDNNINCEDFEIHIEPRYAWFRPGSVTETQDGISFLTPGLGNVKLTTIFEDDPNEGVGSEYSTKVSRLLGQASSENATSTAPVLKIVRLDSSGQKVGFVAGTESVPSISEMQSTIRTKKMTEQARIHKKFGDNKAPVAEAIQCAVMWTLIYNPVENGPFMPVSRSENWAFTDKSGATTQDWTYTIFGTFGLSGMFPRNVFFLLPSSIDLSRLG